MPFKTNIKREMNSLSFTYTLIVFLDISVLVTNLWQTGRLTYVLFMYFSCLTLGLNIVQGANIGSLRTERSQDFRPLPQSTFNCLFKVRVTFAPWLNFPPTKDNHFGSAPRTEGYLCSNWAPETASRLSLTKPEAGSLEPSPPLDPDLEFCPLPT